MFRADNEGTLRVRNDINEFKRALKIMFNHFTGKHLAYPVYRIEVIEKAILMMATNGIKKPERESLMLCNNAHILSFLEEKISAVFDKANENGELFEKDEDKAKYNGNLEDTDGYDKNNKKLRIPTDHKQVQMALIDELVRIQS